MNRNIKERGEKMPSNKINSIHKRKMIGIGLLAAVVIVLAIPASVKAVSFDADESALITQGTNVDMDFSC
jgi:hypothetical protein